MQRSAQRTPLRPAIIATTAALLATALPPVLADMQAVSPMQILHLPANWGQTNEHPKPATAPAPAPAAPSKPAKASVTSEPAGSSYVIVDHHVSNNFTQEIEGAMDRLPQGVLAALVKSGFKVELSHTVTEAVPSARNQQVRGYEPHSTWNSVFGMYNRTTRKLIMAEYAESQRPADAGKLTTLDNPQRRAGILRHEFGHAIDNYLGNFSHTQAFKDAYEKGKKTISKPEQTVLAYYLQPGYAGPEETFAEVFALLDHNGCDRDSDILLQNHFPELVSIVRAEVAEIN